MILSGLQGVGAEQMVLWEGMEEGLAGLEERGLDVDFSWRGFMYGNVSGGLEHGVGVDGELSLKLGVDLGKVLGLRGFEVVGVGRYRGGDGINEDVGAVGAFNPSNIQTGTGLRLIQAYVGWSLRENGDGRTLLKITGGWQNPFFFFVQQPDSKLFVNNALTQTKGLGANIPFGGSYVMWGGTVRVEPVSWGYVQGGLFAAIPDGAASDNHGVDFSTGNVDGVYGMGEMGVTPTWGGKIALGMYYWGMDRPNFSGDGQDPQWGLYGQFDYPLFGKEKTSTHKLNWFNFVQWAPEDNNPLPFYVHSGVVWSGWVPGRELDRLGVAIGYGKYSDDLAQQQRRSGKSAQDEQAVIELDYRLVLAKEIYLQPFVQYLWRPDGTRDISHATVVGINLGGQF